MVSGTLATPTTQDLLSAWYSQNPNNPPNSTLNTPGAKQWDTAIPQSWSGNKSSSKLYTQVVRNDCRGCHQTGHGLNNTYSAKDWSSSAQFLARASDILTYVCKNKQMNFPKRYMMPQARVTQDLFWQTTARAHLIAALTEPGGPQMPDFNGYTASCDVNKQ